MRTLNQGTAAFLRQGIKPRIFVRVFDSGGNDILVQGTKVFGDYEDRITTCGAINQSIKPEGGMAEVSGAEINRLVLDERLTLCTEASLDPRIEASYRGAGRILKSAIIYAGEFIGARDALSGNFSNIAVVCGRLRMGSGPYTFTVYRGFLQFTVPADLTTLENAYLSLPGQGLFLSQNGFLGGIPLNPHFAVHLVEGNWATLTDEGALYNDFEGWETSGDYTLTDFNEPWETDEYDTTNYIRLNQAGRDYVLSKAGDIARFMLVSELDSNYTGYPTPAPGAQVVQFDAYNAKLNLRYNSKTLDNQNIEILYGLETLPATIGGDTLDRVWTGVIDEWTLTDRELTLTGRQNDHKKNLMLPQFIFEKSAYPHLPDENIGRAIPIIYGDFQITGLHKEGVAYVADEDVPANVYSLRDYIKAYIYDDRSSILAQMAEHAVKAIEFMATIYERGIESYVILAGTLVAVAGQDNKKIEISANVTTKFPNRLIETDDVQPVCMYIPKDGENFGADNWGNAIDEYQDNYTTVGAGDSAEYWFNMRPFGVTDLFDNRRYVCFYTEALDGYDNHLVCHVYTYNTDATWDKQTTINSDGWHYIDLYGYVDNRNALAYSINFSNITGAKITRISNLCLAAGYQKSIETEVYLSAQGRPDDGSGTVTGTPAALLENPSHVIESIVRSEMGLAATEIDIAAFDTAATDLTGMKLAFQLLDRKGAREILADVAAQSRLMLWWDEQDRLTCKLVDSTDAFPHSLTDVPDDLDIFTTTGDPTGGSFTRHPIISGPEIRLMEMADVKNDFVVKYKKNYATGEYGAVLTCNKDAETLDDTILTALGTTAATLTGLCTACFSRIQAVQTLEIEAWAIRDETTATALMVHLVNWFSKRRYIIEFTAGITAMEKELGDFINVRDDRIEDLFGTAVMNVKKWIIKGLHPDMNNQTYRIEAIEVG